MLDHIVKLKVALRCPGIAHQLQGTVTVDPREIKRLEEVNNKVCIVMVDGERFVSEETLSCVQYDIRRAFERIRDYETERDIERMNRELDGKN